MMKDALAEPDVRTCTLTDIATLAGVSTATVSRVVNGSGTVSRKTKLKVLNAISGLRYRPNTHAAELGRGNRGIPRNRSADAAASYATSADSTSGTVGAVFNKRRMERRLQLLEEENSRLRRLVEELTGKLEIPERVAH